MTVPLIHHTRNTHIIKMYKFIQTDLITVNNSDPKISFHHHHTVCHAMQWKRENTWNASTRSEMAIYKKTYSRIYVYYSHIVHRCLICLYELYIQSSYILHVVHPLLPKICNHNPLRPVGFACVTSHHTLLTFLITSMAKRMKQKKTNTDSAVRRAKGRRWAVVWEAQSFRNGKLCAVDGTQFPNKRSRKDKFNGTLTNGKWHWVNIKWEAIPLISQYLIHLCILQHIKYA